MIIRKIEHIFATRMDWFQKTVHELSNRYWYNFPLGKKPRADKKDYISLAEKVKLEDYPQIIEFEKRSGYVIDREWLDDLALHTQIVIKNSPLCYGHGRVLYSALSSYIKKLDKSRITIIETGTARGFSSICMAKALYDQRREGTIITFDVLPHNSKMYWNCLDDIEGPKTRKELLKPWSNLLRDYIIFQQGKTKLELPKVKIERVNFAFLDGAHTYEDVMFEFKQIKDQQVSGDMIIYDDYTPQQFPGLVQAVDEICKNYNYKRIDIQAHFDRGYVVAVKE